MEVVRHHEKYKEIHGIDEIVMMDKGEHQKLHKKLRRENKCNIPVDELHQISVAANNRAVRNELNPKSSEIYDWRQL